MKIMLSLGLGAAMSLATLSVAHAAVLKDTGWLANSASAEQSSVQRGADENIVIARSKKRVKGGSGCDDPGDAAEHPECR